MEENSNAKWIVIGSLVLAVIVGLVWAERSYEEPLHMNADDADHMAERLKPIELGEDDGAVVLALPGKKTGSEDTNKAVAVGALPAPMRRAVMPLETGSGGIKVELDTNHWLTGRVVLSGSPPPALPVAMDPDCAAAAKQLNGGRTPMTDDFVVGKESALADVVVTVEGFVGKLEMADRPSVEISIEGCLPRPKVAMAMVGQPLGVKNRGEYVLSLKGWSKVAGNTVAENLILPGAPMSEMTFGAPEENIRLGFEELKWAEALVTVVSHPYYSVTDTNGVFRIPLPPKGTYRLKVFHRKLEPVYREITVAAEADMRADVGLVYRP
jgi:hypothetical protein